VTTYLYRCGTCGTAFNAAARQVSSRPCRHPGCSGPATRVPGIALTVPDEWPVAPIDDDGTA
jgi:hypothetical protein